MMDPIFKLQPHRTMHLQGFDDYGAAAALWGASDTGFTVSGVFRDMADFAVLVLFQKDDPFGHPRFSYLPDGDLTGLVLDFDVTWSGIQSWESLKSAWTDWNALDYSVNGVGSNAKKWFGTPGITVTPNTTGRTGASATYVLNLNSPQPGDKVTLWYQNQAFISPAITPGNPTTDQALWWQGSVATTDQALWWQGNAAYNHWVKIGSATYPCLEDSLNSAGVASNIAAQINASDPDCSCTTGGAYGNEIFISLRSGNYGPVAVSSSDGSGGATLSNYQHWVKIGSITYSCYEGSLNSAQIAANVAAQINATDPNCTTTVGGQYNNEILITLKAGVAGPVAVSSSDGSAAASLTQGTAAATVLNNIANQINGTNWVLNGPAVLSAAVVAPNQLVITATPGADGNMVAFYQTDNNFDYDDLNGRAGSHSFGYVEPSEAVGELLEEAPEPFVDDMKRRLEMGLEDQASQFCQGILLGLYGVRDGRENDILNWVPDFPGEAAANALKVGSETGGAEQGGAPEKRETTPAFTGFCTWTSAGLGLASQARSLMPMCRSVSGRAIMLVI